MLRKKMGKKLRISALMTIFKLRQSSILESSRGLRVFVPNRKCYVTWYHCRYKLSLLIESFLLKAN